MFDSFFGKFIYIPVILDIEITPAQCVAAIIGPTGWEGALMTPSCRATALRLVDVPESMSRQVSMGDM